MTYYQSNNTLIAANKRWNPTKLSGLTLWLDANNTASVTTNISNGVTRWADLSGNSNDAVIDIAAPTFDLYGMNNKPALIFDRTLNHCLVINNILNLSNTHFVSAVYRHISGGNARYLCKWNNTGTASWMLSGLSGTSQSTRYIISNNGTNTTTTTAASRISSLDGNYFTVPTVAVGQQLGNGTNTLGLYINGTLSPTLGSPTSGPFAANTPTTLGRLNQQTIDYSSFAISEIVVCSSASLITTDRQKLEGYLAHKWKTNSLLPSDHPYKISPPR